MDIVIAGAGEVGTHLATMLSKQEHNIMLIDNDEEKHDITWQPTRCHVYRGIMYFYRCA